VAAYGFDSLITSVLTPVLRCYSLFAITKDKRCALIVQNMSNGIFTENTIVKMSKDFE